MFQKVADLISYPNMLKANSKCDKVERTLNCFLVGSHIRSVISEETFLELL